MAMLEVSHLEKHFGDTQVLKDINFTLEQGRVSGHHRLLGLGQDHAAPVPELSGEPRQRHHPGGRPAAAGRNRSRPGSLTARSGKKRLKFGLVFQNFNLFPQYTALENVMLAGQLLAKERPDFKRRKKEIFAEIRSRAEDLLTQVGLQDRMGNYPDQLSGGQQQRVAIARALALDPDILCFDEPTSALDPELTGEVLRVIRSLSERHMTMIIVTHEMAFARDVADEVMFMDGGVIVERGPAHQVIEHPQEERTKLFLSHYSAS